MNEPEAHRCLIVLADDYLILSNHWQIQGDLEGGEYSPKTPYPPL